jgi:hypothetical protein
MERFFPSLPPSLPGTKESIRNSNLHAVRMHAEVRLIREIGGVRQKLIFILRMQRPASAQSIVQSACRSQSKRIANSNLKRIACSNVADGKLREWTPFVAMEKGVSRARQKAHLIFSIEAVKAKKIGFSLHSEIVVPVVESKRTNAGHAPVAFIWKPNLHIRIFCTDPERLRACMSSFCGLGMRRGTGIQDHQ